MTNVIDKIESKNHKTKRAIEIQNSIRQILFQDWDPININENSNLSDEYDRYIAPIYRILVGNRSEEEIMNLLLAGEREIFNESKNVDELQAIAQKFLKLNAKIES